MDASKFPITTGYGQVPGYPVNNGWHRGEDRAMPMDTPVLVNGCEIGLSGNTGLTTGPHLHIGRFVGGGDTNPNGGGFNFSEAVVTEIGEDTTNGRFVRIQAEGASWVYLHLSRVTTSVGQKLIRKVPLPTCTYSLEDAPKTWLTKLPTTNWYDLNAPTFSQIRPVTTLPADTPFYTAGYAHRDGHTYAMTEQDYNKAIRGDYSTNNGINILDLKPVPAPKPYTPPAAPEKIPLVRTYELLTTVMSFNTAADAKARNRPVTTRDKGTYILIKEDEQARELVKKNQDRESFWVNHLDNKVEEVKPVPEPTIPDREPEPEPITIPDHQPPKPVVPETHELFDGGESIKLKSSNSIPIFVKALDGGEPEKLPLPPYKELNITHWFEITDRYNNTVRYYQDDTLHANNRFYALKADWFPDPYKVAEALNKAEKRVYSRFDSNRDGTITISDFIQTPVKIGGQLYTSGKAVINTAFKSPQVKRFIDGFRAGSKK